MNCLNISLKLLYFETVKFLSLNSFAMSAFLKLLSTSFFIKKLSANITSRNASIKLKKIFIIKFLVRKVRLIEHTVWLVLKRIMSITTNLFALRIGNLLEQWLIWHEMTHSHFMVIFIKFFICSSIHYLFQFFSPILNILLQ